MKICVFISNHHSLEEDAFTAQIAADLEAAGAEVFVDRADMATGDLVAHFKRESTAQKWFVLIVTPAAIASSRVNYQTILASIAQREGRLQGVVSLVLQQCPEEQFNTLLRSLHLYEGIVCDATSSYEVGRDQLIEALTAPRPELLVSLPDTPSDSAVPAATEQAIDPATVRIARGSHTTPEEGVSVMELVSYLAGESFSHRPTNASGVISEFLFVWNDALDDDDRQMLRPYAQRVVGTASSPEVERRRSLLALDWQRRTFLPTWLQLAGLEMDATACEELPPLTIDSIEIREQARRVVADAKQEAYGRFYAAVHDYSVFNNPDSPYTPYNASIQDDVGSSAGVAIRAAAGSAVSYAADLAAEPDLQAVAWDPTWEAIESDGWDPAKYDAEYESWKEAVWEAERAAWYAAGAASGAAAWKAAWRAGKSDVHGASIAAAVRETLAPTVAQLQQSALGLLERMVAEH